jgi:hypothetical protein
LAQDTKPSVQRAAFRQLARRGDPNDPLVEAVALAMLEQPTQYELALRVLARTATPAAFLRLWQEAEAGSSKALVATAKQARTPEQRQQVLSLTRRWLLVEDLYQRQDALSALQTLSRVPQEEALLLEVAVRYQDDFISWALWDATPHALPALEALLQQNQPGDPVLRGAIRMIQHHSRIASLR